MADLSIPGVNGQYEKLVEAIMKAERLPREKEATALEKYKGQLSYWQSLNQFSTQLKDIARSFYSYNNPFNEHIASSSNEASFTVLASRDAKEQSTNIFIKQIATSDSFLSDELPKDLKIDEGHYIFRVGEKTLDLNWKGGNYKSFLQAINRRGKGFLTASEIKVSPKTTSILISSSLLGEKNKLTFEEDAHSLAIKLGLIKQGESEKEIFEHLNVKLPAFSNEELKLKRISSNDNVNNLIITFSLEDAKLKKEETENKITKNNDSEKDNIASSTKNNVSPDNEKLPVFETIGSVAYEGVVLKNNPSDIPPINKENKTDNYETSNKETNKIDSSLNKENDVKEETPKDQNISDDALKKKNNTIKPKSLNIFSVQFENGEVAQLENIKDTNERQTLTLPIDSKKKINSILLNNNNEFTINIESVKFSTKPSDSEYVPSHPASIASDAVILYQGIEMKRDTNAIKDIIPSLTINLHGNSEKLEEINVKPNIELVKSSIIEFVAKYNRLIAEINILTNNKPEIIEELTYFSPEEKDAALKRLGVFYGDTTLSSLKGNLISRISNAYGNSSDLSIKLLSQIGTSTNANISTGIDSSRLRGYLEIDEKILEKALTENMEGVKTFFGYDSDGDIIIDDGLAFSIYEYLNPYTQRGGIFFTKMTGVEDKIKISEKKIVAYDKKLSQKETELKRKYGAMEGTLKSLSKQSDAISNFRKSMETKDK